MPSQTVASFSQLEPHRTRTTLRPGSQYQPMWKPRRETPGDDLRTRPKATDSVLTHPLSLDTRKHRTMWQHRQDTVTPDIGRVPLLLIRENHVATSSRRHTSLSENQRRVREPFSLFPSSLLPSFHLYPSPSPSYNCFAAPLIQTPTTPLPLLQTNPSRY